VKDLQNGKEPLHLVQDARRNWFPHVDCFACLVPSDVPWRQRFDYLTRSAEKENPMSYALRRKAAS